MTTATVTIAERDLLEIEGTDYLVLSPLEREILVTREKATGDVTIRAWADHYANGWFAFPDADHERLADYLEPTTMDPGWRLYLAEDVIEPAARAAAQEPEDRGDVFWDLQMAWDQPGVFEWYEQHSDEPTEQVGGEPSVLEIRDEHAERAAENQVPVGPGLPNEDWAVSEAAMLLGPDADSERVAAVAEELVSTWRQSQQELVRAEGERLDRVAAELGIQTGAQR
jgi:hypothetical protein